MERSRAVAVGRRIRYKSEHMTLGSILFSKKLETTRLRLTSLTELLGSLSLRKET